jgi:hypothetical protein
MIAMTRKRFPIEGIYTAIGGICESYYLDDDDARRFRYLMPAEYMTPTCSLGDCWIVDKDGQLNPGTNVSPVPFCLDAIGRRIA